MLPFTFLPFLFGTSKLFSMLDLHNVHFFLQQMVNIFRRWKQWILPIQAIISLQCWFVWQSQVEHPHSMSRNSFGVQFQNSTPLHRKLFQIHVILLQNNINTVLYYLYPINNWVVLVNVTMWRISDHLCCHLWLKQIRFWGTVCQVLRFIK